MATLFEVQSYEEKMHAPMRELKVALKEGKTAKSSSGLVDTRLFTGENKLLCIMDEYGNWFFKYSNTGLLPEPLKCKFTRVSKAIEYAKQYFAKRDLEVTEVKDVHAT